ncbi:MAG: protein phosphatase 2C domain-containing protein [Bacteroidetes bacterium]|nr:MAG: protein phosphatase 2C domain-containing protein [Bacteroidota bacterium]TAG86115.1 MAG: protein phosphatase 2C domain-containing protein [Bacteroidota bacterium]
MKKVIFILSYFLVCNNSFGQELGIDFNKFDFYDYVFLFIVIIIIVLIFFLCVLIFSSHHEKNSSPKKSKGNMKEKRIQNTSKKKIKCNFFKKNTKNNKSVIKYSKYTVKKNDIILPHSNIITTKDNWFSVGRSIIGKSHIKNNIPCQDFCHLEMINDLWGIAIVCDGAGSAINSHIGSEFVAKESAKIFKSIFLKEQLEKNKELLPNDIWQELAKKGLYQVKQNLDNFAKNEGYQVESLACTIILAIYSPFGILVTHIGDGRAGFLTHNNEWKSMIIPWKGEEPNQTVFITSAIWNENVDNYIESRIIKEQPFAFTLMSDGCEAHSFECSIFDKQTNEWNDPNLPFPKFFNPLVEGLKKMKLANMSEEEIQDEWNKFLSSGTPSLVNEPDDKTLILGIFINEKPLN